MPKRPKLFYSHLTGRIYVSTNYRPRKGQPGQFIAERKTDITDEFGAMLEFLNREGISIIHEPVPVVKNLMGQINPPSDGDVMSHFKSRGQSFYHFLGKRGDTPEGQWTYLKDGPTPADLTTHHRPIAEFFDVVMWNGEETRRFLW